MSLLAMLSGSTVWTPPDPPPDPGDGTAPPVVPTFDTGTAVSITAGTSVATVVAANPTGTHFRLLAGAHDVDNVLMKTDQHLRFDAGAYADGTGVGYAFRPESSTTTGVAIGGVKSGGVRPKISNYGNGTTSQGYGAIMGRPHDVLGGAYGYANVENWFIYGLDLEENSSNGVKMGDGWTIYDCEIHGHTTTGLNCDRGVGGLIHSNLIYWNALNPATGSSANGANIKITWINGDVGRTSITPIDRTKAQFIISNNTIEALDRNGGPGDTNIGVWMDLDCQQVLVEYNTLDDHPSNGIFWEGCNDGLAQYNTITNTNGYGPAYNADFCIGAIAAGESTNITFTHNTLVDCDYTMMNRMSNRSADWLNPSSSRNYGYSAGPRYWLLDTNTIPAVSGQSNIWTGNNTFSNNTLVNCNRVVINEGTDDATQTTHGSTNLGSIVFSGNNYAASPGVAFYNLSTTSINLSAWQALGRQ